MDDQLTEEERSAVLNASNRCSNISKPHQENRNVILGVKFAVWHLLLFSLSVYLNGKIAGGWLTLFFMEIPWFPADLPWSLLDIILMQKDIWQSLDKIRTLSSMLDFIFYPPILVHGLIGTIWWGFLPTIYLKYNRKKSET
jgi:hypothetical protein